MQRVGELQNTLRNMFQCHGSLPELTKRYTVGVREQSPVLVVTGSVSRVIRNTSGYSKGGTSSRVGEHKLYGRVVALQVRARQARDVETRCETEQNVLLGEVGVCLVDLVQKL